MLQYVIANPINFLLCDYFDFANRRYQCSGVSRGDFSPYANFNLPLHRRLENAVSQTKLRGETR